MHKVLLSIILRFVEDKLQIFLPNANFSGDDLLTMMNFKVVSAEEVIPLSEQTFKDITFQSSFNLLPSFEKTDFSWRDLDKIGYLGPVYGAAVCEAISCFFPFFPRPKDLSKVLNLAPELNENREIVVYAGSFRPWHKGHSACLELCKKSPKVVVIDQNPFKDHDPSLCYWQLYQETKQILSTIKSSNIYLYSGFCGKQSANPTVDWIGDIEKKTNLLMGEDSFFSLPKWKNYRELLRKISGLIVTPRLRTEKEYSEQKALLLKTSPHLIIERLDNHEYEDLSSTEIRQD